MRVGKGGEIEKGKRKISKEVMAKNFTIFWKKVIHTSNKPKKLDKFKETYIQIHNSKNVERQRENFKSTREKWLIMYKGIWIKLTLEFPSEIVKAKGSGIMYSMCWKRKTVNQESYMNKLFFKNKSEI